MTDDFKNYLMRNGLNELDTVANIEYTAYAVCSEYLKLFINYIIIFFNFL